ncbi:WXG100 family type VII secretion target [Candidatus Contubernalis alkaliaceticus]|uniref:WXG100 family type VII secretion target n=1 Tax=Candidatus Contubernalis alkaliaceticus TaxID=338645 RepID=UPI001F4C2E65|nr:WXG100 family type VII secretion target [Candidatus Contubernalis alkalaceticus]UNC91122.1 WXG100 family type VII secretion target [Candidatus Contubernalis alkalaceticus]
MDITLKVQPDVLIAKAGELSTEKTTIMGLMDQTKSNINSLAGVWKSQASDEYQGRFKQIYNDIDNMLAIVSEYISDLNEIASVYSTAEKNAKSEAEGLPTDGVFRV